MRHVTYDRLTPAESEALDHAVFDAIRRDPWAINTPGRLARQLFDYEEFKFPWNSEHYSDRALLMPDDRELQTRAIRSSLQRLHRLGYLDRYEAPGLNHQIAYNYTLPQ